MSDNQFFEVAVAVGRDFENSILKEPYQGVCCSMNTQPHKINSNAENQSLEELAEEIAKRGNDMQTTHPKDDIYEQLVSGVKQICELNGADEVCIQRNGDQYYIFAVDRQEVDYLRIRTMNENKQLSEQEQTVMKKLAEYTAKDKKVEIITAKDGTIIGYETLTKRRELFRVAP